MKKVYTNGRSAWYDTDGKPRTPFVVGVAGGSASGEWSDEGDCAAVFKEKRQRRTQIVFSIFFLKRKKQIQTK
jgi:hypothetical protein